MDLEFAELVGILLGDGSLGIYASKPDGKIKTQYRIKVTVNSEKDARYSVYISTLFFEVFGASPLIRKRKECKALDICLYGRKHLELLLREGLVLAPKWRRAVIPNRFLKPPLDRLVIRGYTDTDGCIAAVDNNGTRYPRIEMKISPSPMQGQLIGILERNGFQPRVNRLERGKVRVVLSGMANLAKWGDIIGYSNERNRRVARSFLDPPPPKQHYKRHARY